MRIETTPRRFIEFGLTLATLTRNILFSNKDIAPLSSPERGNKKIISLCNQVYEIDAKLRSIIYPENTTEREGRTVVIVNDSSHYCVYSVHVYPKKGFTFEVIHGEPAENKAPLYAGIAKIIGIYRVGLRKNNDDDTIIFTITTQNGEENLYIVSSGKQKSKGVEITVSKLVFPQETTPHIDSASKHGAAIIKIVNAVISDKSVRNNIKPSEEKN